MHRHLPIGVTGADAYWVVRHIEATREPEDRVSGQEAHAIEKFNTYWSKLEATSALDYFSAPAQTVHL